MNITGRSVLSHLVLKEAVCYVYQYIIAHFYIFVKGAFYWEKWGIFSLLAS